MPCLVHGQGDQLARPTSGAPAKRFQMTSRSVAGVSSPHIQIAILLVVIIVAGLPLALGYLWILYQRRLRQHRRHDSNQSIGLVVMSSSVSVDYIVKQDSYTESNGRDIESRFSTETILSPVSPKRALSELNRMLAMPATSTEERKDNILDRRGRAQLKCDTMAQYAIDMVVAVPVPQSCPANCLRVLPEFGFDEGTITPPIGSPLWQRKPDSAHMSESPRQQHSGRELVAFSDIMFRPYDASNGV